MDEDKDRIPEETKKRLEQTYGLKRPDIGESWEFNKKEESDVAIRGKEAERRIQYTAANRPDRFTAAPENFVIEPGVGIGALTIGMPREEAERILETYRRGNLFYLFDIDYDEAGRIAEIEIDRGTGLEMNAVLSEGTKLFEIPVEDLLPMFGQYGADFAQDDAYVYDYADAGITFWRERLLSRSDLDQAWFLEMSAENREDELRRLFFETVRIKRKSADREETTS